VKVKLVKENSVIEVNDSYGLRLITQGKAVAVKANEAGDTPKQAEKATKKAKGDA